jgi:methionine-rich copper-binding protein CopC
MKKTIPSLVGALLITALTMTPALAHSTLVSMTPAQDSIQTSAPTQVVLTFDENITPSGEGLTVTAPDGVRVDLGEPRASGATISVNLGPIKLNGHYVINYRVVSADGHPLEASAGFEILIPALVSSATPLVDATGEGETGIDTREGLSGKESNYEIAILAVVGVLTAALLVYWLRRRNRATRPTKP